VSHHTLTIPVLGAKAADWAEVLDVVTGVWSTMDGTGAICTLPLILNGNSETLQLDAAAWAEK